MRACRFKCHSNFNDFPNLAYFFFRTDYDRACGDGIVSLDLDVFLLKIRNVMHRVLFLAADFFCHDNLAKIHKCFLKISLFSTKEEVSL